VGVWQSSLIKRKSPGKEVDLNPAVRASIGRRKIDRDDIEAAAYLPPGGLRKPLAEDAGQTAEHLPLVFVDGELGGNDVAASAGLHFDETERVAVPADQVDVSG
jgi:hypothetical protein